MKNNLGALNGYLFEQLDRLNAEMSSEELEGEIRRSHAISNIAKNIINNGDLVLRAKASFVDRLDAGDELPEMLEGDNDKKATV